ncbi:MAG: WD40 repeat domain-containing protein, partial [Anaerolineae bacterium]|nr:WD40 repeat domain-containing protein [Anaerolineae bacterium]
MFLILTGFRVAAQDEQSFSAPERPAISANTAAQVVELGRLSPGSISGVSWSPVDQSQLAVAMADGIRLYDIHFSEALPRILDYDGWTLRGLAFSPDGAWIASGDESGQVYLWDVRTGEQIFRIAAHKDGVLQTAFSPDNTLLMSVGESEVAFWDVQTGAAKGVLKHNSLIAFAAFWPHSDLLLTITDDDVLRLWNVQTRRALSATFLDEPIRRLTFTPDGEFLIALAQRSHQANIQVIPLADHELGPVLLEAPTNVTFTAGRPNLLSNMLVSRDGNYLFTTFRKTSLWSIDPGKPIELVREMMILAYDGQYLSLSPDGSILAQADSGSVVLLHLGSPEAGTTVIPTLPPTPVATPAFQTAIEEPGLTELVYDEGAVRALSFDDSGRLYSIYRNREVPYQWDLSLDSVNDISRNPTVGDAISSCFGASACNRDVLLEHHKQAVGLTRCETSPTLLSPDGRLRAECSLEHITLFDVATNQELGVLHGRSIRQYRFSPDGARIVSWTDDANAVSLWDVATTNKLLSVSSYPAPIFSPDGSVLV